MSECLNTYCRSSEFTYQQSFPGPLPTTCCVNVLPVHLHPKRNEGQQRKVNQFSFSETWDPYHSYHSDGFPIKLGEGVEYFSLDIFGQTLNCVSGGERGSRQGVHGFLGSSLRHRGDFFQQDPEFKKAVPEIEQKGEHWEPYGTLLAWFCR